ELNERLRRAMQETHHRVRNSLQLIAALTDMQAYEETGGGTAEEFQRIGGQVRALAAVHDILTHQAGEDGEANDLSAKEVLEKLAGLLRETLQARRLETEIEDIRLSARQGTSLAVVTNELVTNALKYGQ